MGEGSVGGLGKGLQGIPFSMGLRGGWSWIFHLLRSPPELLLTCWECPKPEKQGGPPEVVILRPVHLGKRRKKSGGGRTVGDRGGETKGEWEGRSDTHLWNSVDTCCSATQSCLTLCDPIFCSTPGIPVLHHLPQLAQTHVHRVGDAIQPSHPVVPFFSCLQSFPASGSFPVSQLFASGGQTVGAAVSASVLPMNIQG